MLVCRDGLPLFACAPDNHEFLFGATAFRQIQDATQARGYLQKSIIVLTAVPIPHALASAAAVIADSYFASGETALEVAFADMRRWYGCTRPPRGPSALRI